MRCLLDEGGPAGSHGEMNHQVDREALPHYGRAIVLATLEDLGVELLDDGGGGEWAHARCPMHTDTSASFAVNVEHGGWKCFAQCGSSPDLARLVQQVEGGEYKEVRRRLRMKVATSGMTPLELLRGRKTRYGPEAEASKPEALFYERSRVPRYMVDPKPLGRGFAKQTMVDWGVGYDKELNAVVIPVKDGGRLVGLVRRCLNPGDPKYKNSYGMAAKGYLLGLDHVKPDERHVYVVEGPLDCIWLHEHGYPAVAILGSSMSEAQADRLKRRFWEVTLAFDNDAAGRAATSKVKHLLERVNIKYVTLPPGIKDIQECDAETLARVL